MKRDSTIIAIVSGKGGVGKSLIAVNLAEMLVHDGLRVALVDADFGQGACPVLMNETPPATIMDLVRFTARTDQVQHETIAGVTLVQVSAEVGETDGREREVYSSLDELIADFRTRYDYILIDAPGGTDGPVRWALDRADIGFLVVVGEPTAVADAYRLARMIWKSDATYPLATIVNFADSEQDAAIVAQKFAKITEHFTGRLPNYLGWVPFSSSVRLSVTRQYPVVRDPGPARDAFARLAQMVVHGRHTPAESLGAA